MPDKPNYAEQNKARLKDITDSIETGIKELFQSDKYKQYLATMSRFHRYSVNNTMLIYMQRPDATLVAGFNKWKDQFGRNVLKGEKGIKIIAPTPYKKKIEQEKLDPDTKLPMRDENGDAIMEEKTVQIPMYKPVTVFDVAQTEGKPLPELAANLTGDVQNYEVFMDALKRSAPVPISIEKIAANMDGYFSLKDQRISIREGMSEVQTVCAAIHEIAHAKLHNITKIPEPRDAPMYQDAEILGVPCVFSNGRIADHEVPKGMFRYDLRGSDDDPGLPVIVEKNVVVNHAGSILTVKPLDLGEDGRIKLTEENGLNFFGGELTAYRFFNQQVKDRSTEEIEAESISYAVCAYYGIATGENSFGYIATWSKDKDLKDLRASLETISRTSSALITDIDRSYAEIMKERGLDKQAETLATEPVQEISVQEPEPTAAPDNGYMPDPTLSVESMNAYGYTDANMLPLSQDRAMELFDGGITVYMLHDDNTEAMVFESWEITEHPGIFGISREDWEKEGELIGPRDVEYRFLNAPTDSCAIYQLKADAPTELRFTEFDRLRQPPAKEHYQPIYTRELYPGDDVTTNLENLFHIFNEERPMDFTGHSLSVSDIVALKRDGAVSYHYCDSIGFKALPDFGKPDNPLKNAEMAMEDDYGMIDGIINNGSQQTEPIKQAPPPKDKKPSVLAKLRQYQQEDRKNDAMHFCAERDI